MTRSLIMKIAGVVGGIVLLALVIFGVAAVSSPSGSQGGLPYIPVSSEPSSSAGLVPSFTPDASSSVDATVPATTVASSPIQTRSDNGNSNDFRVTRSDGSGGSGSGSGEGEGEGGSGGTTPPVKPRPKPKTIKDQLPLSVAGYSTSGTQVFKTTAQVALQPIPSGRIPMSLALLTVHDFGTTAKAKAFIDSSVKRIYPSNQQSVPVKGGYVLYGTQATQFGEVAFYSGRYAYEITVTATDGDPLGLKDEAARLVATYNLP